MAARDALLLMLNKCADLISSSIFLYASYAESNVFPRKPLVVPTRFVAAQCKIAIEYKQDASSSPSLAERKCMRDD